MLGIHSTLRQYSWARMSDGSSNTGWLFDVDRRREKFEEAVANSKLQDHLDHVTHSAYHGQVSITWRKAAAALWHAAACSSAPAVHCLALCGTTLGSAVLSCDMLVRSSLAPE